MASGSAVALRLIDLFRGSGQVWLSPFSRTSRVNSSALF